MPYESFSIRSIITSNLSFSEAAFRDRVSHMFSLEIKNSTSIWYRFTVSPAVHWLFIYEILAFKIHLLLKWINFTLKAASWWLEVDWACSKLLILSVSLSFISSKTLLSLETSLSEDCSITACFRINLSLLFFIRPHNRPYDPGLILNYVSLLYQIFNLSACNIFLVHLAWRSSLTAI